MACPYFLPDEPEPAGEASDRPRPPLGRFHGGRCLSGHEQSTLPLERCNLGYARGLGCFPTECQADASRFSVGADDGDTITVQWCIEANHRPLRWGATNWSCSGGGFREPVEDPVLRSQMTAYIASYLFARELTADG